MLLSSWRRSSSEATDISYLTLREFRKPGNEICSNDNSKLKNNNVVDVDGIAKTCLHSDHRFL